MDFSIAALLQHGYWIVIAVVFLESVGMPIPAALVMLLAGSACAQHELNTGYVLGGALAAMLSGDALMYVMGRYTGWWLLGVLCRLSLQPEACIFRSAESFYKRGRKLLLIAKFLPGINTMAAPLAGSMNLPVIQFFALDAAGVLLYIVTYFMVGYLFSDFLKVIRQGYTAFGSVMGWLVVALFVVWMANRVRLWVKVRHEAPVPMVHPREVADRLYEASPDKRGVAVFDVRSHGYYEPETMRIQGSTRLEPNTLTDQVDELPRDKDIILYCTCLREATALRVARMLAERGIPSFVIEGGLSGWKKEALPLEPVPAEEVVLLPRFS
jgi:membrane protein DedA with SNARE-associated domain/rhodanese-related sulfurtransferase